MLAKRLIHTLSVSMDAEEGMISRLKVSCHSIALTASYAKPVPGNRTRVIWQRGRWQRGKRTPARFFFCISFTIFAHFHLGAWNRPLNEVHLRLGGRRDGERCALYHSTIHNTTYLFLVKPPPLPPSKFHLLFFVWLLSRLVCKANLACHFKLISIQWRPLNLFLLFCSMRVGMSIQTSFIVCLQISASVQIWILVLMISFPKPMLPLELVLVCLCYRLVFTFLFNTELMPEL